MDPFIFFCQFSKAATFDIINEACLFKDKALEIT